MPRINTPLLLTVAAFLAPHVSAQTVTAKFTADYATAVSVSSPINYHRKEIPRGADLTANDPRHMLRTRSDRAYADFHPGFVHEPNQEIKASLGVLAVGRHISGVAQTGVSVGSALLTLRSSQTIQGRLIVNWYQRRHDGAIVGGSVDLHANGSLDFFTNPPANAGDWRTEKTFPVSVGPGGLQIRIKVSGYALPSSTNPNPACLGDVVVRFVATELTEAQTYGPACFVDLSAKRGFDGRIYLKVPKRFYYNVAFIFGTRRQSIPLPGGCTLLTDAQVVIPVYSTTYPNLAVISGQVPAIRPLKFQVQALMWSREHGYRDWLPTSHALEFEYR